MSSTPSSVWCVGLFECFACTLWLKQCTNSSWNVSLPCFWNSLGKLWVPGSAFPSVCVWLTVFIWWLFLLFAGYNNAVEQFKQSAVQACLYFNMCVSLKWLVVTPTGGRGKPWHEIKPRPPAWLFKMKVCSGSGGGVLSHWHRCQFLWPRVWPPADLVMEIKWQEKKMGGGKKENRFMPAVFSALQERLCGCEIKK